MSLVASLTLVLSLVAAVSAPVFPFATLRDAAKAASSAGQPACEGEAIKVELGSEWVVWANGQKALFVHFTPAGEPDYVYVTSFGGDPYELRVMETLTIDEAVAKYGPSPCPVFVEKASS